MAHYWLLIASVAGLLLGGAVVYTTLHRYRRVGGRRLLFLSSGFGALSLSSVVRALLHDLLGYEGTDAGVAGSVLAGIGLAVIFYAAYLTPSSPTERAK